jgi:hypothetical protein
MWVNAIVTGGTLLVDVYEVFQELNYPTMNIYSYRMHSPDDSIYWKRIYFLQLHNYFFYRIQISASFGTRLGETLTAHPGRS